MRLSDWDQRLFDQKTGAQIDARERDTKTRAIRAGCAKDEHAPCLRCNGTGTVFHATCGNSRSGEIEGYDDDCPQCGGSGEEERFSGTR